MSQHFETKFKGWYRRKIGRDLQSQKCIIWTATYGNLKGCTLLLIVSDCDGRSLVRTQFQTFSFSLRCEDAIGRIHVLGWPCGPWWHYFEHQHLFSPPLSGSLPQPGHLRWFPVRPRRGPRPVACLRTCDGISCFRSRSFGMVCLALIVGAFHYCH